MRRKSIKKSSMFKVQQEKIIFKKYLDNIENSSTVRSYPTLLHVFIILSRVSKGPPKSSITIAMNLEMKTLLLED